MKNKMKNKITAYKGFDKAKACEGGFHACENPLDGSNIDWEQRKYEIAKSAMNSILANREMVAAMLRSPNPKGFEYQVARNSVFFADALIAELKKPNETK